MPAQRIRIGVVGCGLIAQVMHLPYLAELSDRFEVVALCDVSEDVAAACARRYGVDRVLGDWEELVSEPLDAVLVATSSDHAPIAIAAAQAGRHVFVEKPMALCSRDAEAVVAAAETARVCVQVGTHKRYDPAYERLAELLPAIGDLRLIRVTTLESPIAPHVAHYPLIARDGSAEVVPKERARAEEAAIDVALGDVPEQTRQCYRTIVLHTLVHELNMLGGLLGEPSEIRSASLTQRCVGINMRYGDAECHLSWVSLPGIARYRQELAFYAPTQRLTLTMPSPFLRNMPSRLTAEGGEVGTATSWERDEIVSFDEAFRRELVEFADCISSGRAPRTPPTDGLRDVRLAEAIARADAAGRAR
ncbi:MAG TPA: Gfo/Idh/MocA family oxidoreductase [Solirubrobacteraceae bacterium]|jgi:predicted dehydrogenase